MRDKHLQIASDSALLAEIRLKVKNELRLNISAFYTIITLKILVFLGASLALYASLFIATSSFVFILAYILLGLFLTLLAFNFAHDFSHNTIFKNNKWNNLGFILIYSFVGAHGEAWKERHVNSHHFAPNVQEYDSDLQITNLIRVTPEMEYKWFHRFQSIYAPLAYSTYSLYWIFIKDFVLLTQKVKRREASLTYILSFAGQKFLYFFYILVLPLIFAKQEALIVISGFLLMHAIQSIFLLFTFFMTHHVLGTTYPETDEKGIIQTSWLMNQVKSSNDMHPFSRNANFILGGFNNHIAHHLFPHIHHAYYPELNRILYGVLNENGITPNQTSYHGGIISHMKLLVKLSKQEG